MLSKRPAVTDFRLQIISPLNATQIFISPDASAAFVRRLERNKWRTSRIYSQLGLSHEFGLDHGCLERDVTSDVQQQVAADTVSAEQPVFEKCELYAYATGIVLMVGSYRVRALSPRQGRDAYNRLIASTGHFIRTRRYIHGRYSDFIAGEQPVRKGDVVLCNLYTPASNLYAPLEIHWTHGILGHVVSDASKQLSPVELAEFSQGSFEEHKTNRGLLRVRLGWEFSSFSTSDVRETALVSAVIVTMGYIWEMHWVVSTNATKRLHETQGALRAHEHLLHSVREFHGYAAILIASCRLTRLTMIERHFSLARALMKEWHLADLSEAIKDSTELLDLIYTHAQQERAEKRTWQLNIILFAITVATLVTGTKDAVEFIHHGRSWIKWLIFVGPITALILFAILWLWFWRPRRPEKP